MNEQSRSSDSIHRVDSAHVDSGPSTEIPEFPEGLLEEHSADLISRLQEWSSDLDRRESEINARTAKLEHEERLQRMESQVDAVDRREEVQSLERRRKDLQEEIKRMSLGNISL